MFKVFTIFTSILIISLPIFGKKNSKQLNPNFKIDKIKVKKYNGDSLLNYGDLQKKIAPIFKKYKFYCNKGVDKDKNFNYESCSFKWKKPIVKKSGRWYHRFDITIYHFKTYKDGVKFINRIVKSFKSSEEGYLKVTGPTHYFIQGKTVIYINSGYYLAGKLVKIAYRVIDKVLKGKDIDNFSLLTTQCGLKKHNFFCLK